jgi:hypothetical protein
MGGHTIEYALQYAREYFSEEESSPDMQKNGNWPPIVAMGREGLGKWENGKGENKIWCKSGIWCHIMNILVTWSNTCGLARIMWESM